MRTSTRLMLMTAVLIPALSAGPAMADLQLNVPDATAAPGQTSVRVPVTVTTDASNEVTDMSGFFQAGTNANVDMDLDDPVVISAIDLTGTIWSSAAGGTTLTVPNANNEASPVNISLNTSGESVLASGDLFTAELDVADDAPLGTYPLKVDDIFGGNGTAFQKTGDAVASQSTPGTLTVVPEPASLALLGMGGLALIGRRRRVSR